MCTLRSVLAVLMTLLILPWGAYAHAGTPVAAMATPAEHSDRTAAEPRPAAVTLRKSCRTMTLPGASCSADRVLPAAEGATGPRHAATHAAGFDDWHATETTPTPPRDPPRAL
ncbi:hypothetical protein DC363_00035 [Thalassorhabdomicrobium marinisediminis]|uniref:Uncharacterized protein n=2 Tax=Thalassorhabdomicrobium marinisediminis TaxID=2170577 RepID=A0A2T7G0L9_9RHOB|nr:hypothetical protein DC363_00035 [Thalassorhabdomicrobium marinisediminis]